MNENFDLKKAVKNDFIFTTDNAEDALLFLQERDRSTLVTLAKDITVTPIAPGDLRLFPKEREDLKVVSHSIPEDLLVDYDADAAYEECARDTKLLISRAKGYERYLLRPQAIPGLLKTTLTGGPGWGILQDKDNTEFAHAINCFLEVRPRDMTLIEVWGAVTGIASDKYQYLSQYSLLEVLLLSAAASDAKLTKFMYSHEMTFATVEFPPEKVLAYSLDKLNFDPNKAKMLMHMRDSDNSNSAAVVWIEITDGTNTLATTGIYAVHKGASSIQKFAEACNSAPSAVKDTVDQVMALAAYKLQFGESTIREVGKRIGISDSVLVKEIKQAKVNGIRFDEMTAYEGYLFLCGLIDSLKVNKSKTKSFCGNEELIESYIKTETKAKIITARWTDIDEERHYKDITNLNPSVAEDPNQVSFFDEA